jgi:pentatricopeptide repeat protein
MSKAFELFGKMPERNVVSSSTMVSGYCKVGDMDMARMLFESFFFFFLLYFALFC